MTECLFQKKKKKEKEFYYSFFFRFFSFWFFFSPIIPKNFGKFLFFYRKNDPAAGSPTATLFAYPQNNFTLWTFPTVFVKKLPQVIRAIKECWWFLKKLKSLFLALSLGNAWAEKKEKNFFLCFFFQLSLWERDASILFSKKRHRTAWRWPDCTLSQPFNQKIFRLTARDPVDSGSTTFQFPETSKKKINFFSRYRGFPTVWSRIEV